MIAPIARRVRPTRTARDSVAWALAASRRHATFALFAFSIALVAPAVAADDAWKAGVAKSIITPRQPIWMSGYSSRDHAAEGKLHDLWTKALVLEDPQGERIALVTLDLVGIGRDLSNRVRDQLESQHGFDRAHVALCTSHTHTGPVVGRNLAAMYFLDGEQQRLVDEYADELQQKIVECVGAAAANVAPCELSWGAGHASFAVNRRNNAEQQIPDLRAEGRLVGPVDHDVPVLAVRDASGKLVAVAFGYACHATVLSSYQWSGDYPGFAQMALEARYPDAVTLFWAGCGADQNPLPRRTVELAHEYGVLLAAAVERVLDAPMRPIAGELDASYAEIELPFAAIPSREELSSQAASDNKYEASRAKLLLDQIAAGQPLAPTYPYPVQSWRLGPDVRFITLGGEVVVDYALRLKKELGRDGTWIAGYANDVMAYIPSRRVLAEGGYEGGGAMVYYGLPTVWAPEVEDAIVEEVRRQTYEAANVTSGTAK